MSDWETVGSSTTSGPELPWNRLVVGAVVFLVVGGALGASLFGDIGEVPCYQVQEEAGTAQQRIFEDEEPAGAVSELADLVRGHPGCFEPRWAAKVERSAREGPPEIGVLDRPRTPEDELPAGVADTELLHDEARFAQRTALGSYYVVPRRGPDDRRQVCLLVLREQDGPATSCAVPGTSALSHDGMPLSVVLTISGPGFAGVAGIVGDGVTEVLVDGVPVSVEGNVFVAEGAPADAPIEVP